MLRNRLLNDDIYGRNRMTRRNVTKSGVKKSLLEKFFLTWTSLFHSQPIKNRHELPRHTSSPTNESVAIEATRTQEDMIFPFSATNSKLKVAARVLKRKLEQWLLELSWWCSWLFNLSTSYLFEEILIWIKVFSCVNSNITFLVPVVS